MLAHLRLTWMAPFSLWPDQEFQRLTRLSQVKQIQERELDTLPFSRTAGSATPPLKALPHAASAKATVSCFSNVRRLPAWVIGYGKVNGTDAVKPNGRSAENDSSQAPSGPSWR